MLALPVESRASSLNLTFPLSLILVQILSNIWIEFAYRNYYPLLISQFSLQVPIWGFNLPLCRLGFLHFRRFTGLLILKFYHEIFILFCFWWNRNINYRLLQFWGGKLGSSAIAHPISELKKKSVFGKCETTQTSQVSYFDYPTILCIWILWNFFSKHRLLDESTEGNLSSFIYNDWVDSVNRIELTFESCCYLRFVTFYDFDYKSKDEFNYIESCCYNDWICSS